VGGQLVGATVHKARIGSDEWGQFCGLATTEIDETHAHGGLNACMSVFAT
jgi:hypothetical protein